MTGAGRETPMHGSRPSRTAAAATILAAALLLSGCAARTPTASNVRVLTVPVTYERHLDAGRNCKPDGAMTYFADRIPIEDDLLGLVFVLSKSAESSSDYSSGSSPGTVWHTTSSGSSEGVRIRLFRCPPEFLGKVRAQMKEDAK